MLKCDIQVRIAKLYLYCSFQSQQSKSYSLINVIYKTTEMYVALCLNIRIKHSFLKQLVFFYDYRYTFI